MKVLGRVKNKFTSFNSSLLPNELRGNKRKTMLFFFSFYLIVISTFFTVVSQFPSFSARGITQIFQIGWLFLLIPLVMLDYKCLLKNIVFSLIIISPFLLYCVIVLLFKINSFSYGATTYVLLSLFLFIIFGSFSKYKNSLETKTIAVSFIASAILYAGVVFITKLRGYDLDNQIYAFGDKNSAGPIFISAAVIAFYVFDKRDAKCIFTKWLIFLFFTLIIALSKTRSVLIVLPIVLFILLFYDIKRPSVSFLILIIFLLAVILIFAVPNLRETLIVNILLNGKTDLDSIFSGRLSQIVFHMQSFKPLLGNGGSYFDCMPISLLCSYGIIGFATLIPILILPFYILFKFRKRICLNGNLKSVLLCFAVVFIAAGLLEGFGYLGPGAKVLVFWFLVGNYSVDVIHLAPINKVTTKYKKVINRCSTISAHSFLIIIQMLFLALSLITISAKSFAPKIGETVIDRLPSSNPIASYTEVKDIQIDPPVSSMCVGQKITFDVVSDPIDAEDKTVFWNTGWIENPCIKVDGYTGEVTAERVGGALLNINRFRIGPNGAYIQFPVSAINDYVFDKAFISTNKFNKSFEHMENELIQLNKGCTSKVFYDDNYIPDESLVEFVSTNNQVAFVENSLIRTMSPGECDINAIIHGKEDTISQNTIHVKVIESDFYPTTSINLDVNHNWYENQQYIINPFFNKNASDQNFTINVSGLKYSIDDNRITFLESGVVSIEVISDSNYAIKNSYQITVLDNKPSHFECNTKRMLIGETKDAKELGLYLVFNNGYKKIVTEDDLLFEASDMANRAWSDRNGLIKNRTTVKAVLAGNIYISCISKINQNVKKDFKIISSVYTQEQYDYITKGVGQLSITFVLLIAIVFSIFISINRLWLLFVALYLTSMLFITIERLLFGFTIFFIVSLSTIIFALFLITALRIWKKKWFPVLFLEEPIEIEYRNENGLTENDYYQFDI